MTKNSTNIKSILPLILILAINIGIGLGVAKTDGLWNQGGFGRDAKLTRSPASRVGRSNGAGKESPVRVGLRENAALKDLVSKVEGKSSLDVFV